MGRKCACERRGVEILWSVCLCVVCWESISSQVLGPSSLIFSGHVRVICGSAQFEYEPDPLKLTRVRSVGHRCLFQAVGMTKRPRIGHDGTNGQEMANHEINQHLQGGQGPVGGPQVPLLGFGEKVKSPN